MDWINVNDRLPDKDQYVIYHAPGMFNSGPQMWIGQYEEGVFYCRHIFFGSGEVTHWMPIPELPGTIDLFRAVEIEVNDQGDCV